ISEPERSEIAAWKRYRCVKRAVDEDVSSKSNVLAAYGKCLILLVGGMIPHHTAFAVDVDIGFFSFGQVLSVADRIRLPIEILRGTGRASLAHAPSPGGGRHHVPGILCHGRLPTTSAFD